MARNIDGTIILDGSEKLKVGTEIFIDDDRSASFLSIQLDEGVEIIRKKGYEINDNVVLSDFQAAGFKLTETSWNGFLQLCKRLRADIGAFTICLDIEARIAFVYDPQTSSEDREIHYLKFSS